MNRRSFLAGTGFAATSSLATAAESLALPNYNPRESAPGPNGPAITPDSKHEKGLRLSITWSMLGQMPVPDTLALLTRLGFHGYEMFDWRDPKLLDTFLQVKDKYPLTCECLVGNKGVIAPRCGPLNPREREEFVRQMSLATEAARKVGTTQLVTLTGNELGGMPRSEQMTNAVAALREIAPMLEKNGVTIRTNSAVTGVEDAKGRKRLRFKSGGDVVGDVVIMATGIRTNLEWLKDSGVAIKRAIVVDDQLRSNVPNVYAAGDVAEGKDVVTGEAAVHAIEPTAQEHGRVVGANMAGKTVRYRGSLLANIVEVCHLDVASFGAWDDAKAQVMTGLRKDRPAYRKLLFRGDRLTGAIILGPSSDIWTTNDVGMLKGLVQSGVSLGPWKAHLEKNPFDIKPAFIASRATGALLPETVLGRPSKAPGDSPVAV